MELARFGVSSTESERTDGFEKWPGCAASNRAASTAGDERGNSAPNFCRYTLSHCSGTKKLQIKYLIPSASIVHIFNLNIEETRRKS
jgi:hypothetical protein